MNMAAISQAFSLSSGPLFASAMAADNLAMAAYLAGISLIPLSAADKQQLNSKDSDDSAGQEGELLVVSCSQQDAPSAHGHSLDHRALLAWDMQLWALRAPPHAMQMLPQHLQCCMSRQGCIQPCLPVHPPPRALTPPCARCTAWPGFSGHLVRSLCSRSRRLLAGRGCCRRPGTAFPGASLRSPGCHMCRIGRSCLCGAHAWPLTPFCWCAARGMARTCTHGCACTLQQH